MSGMFGVSFGGRRYRPRVAIRPPGQARLALVSTFPPCRDGIAKYAEQLADAQAQGREVVRIGLPGSRADIHLRLGGGVRPLRLLRKTRRSDDVWIMWHPEFFIQGRYWSRVATYAALGVVGRRRRVRMVVHEPVSGPRAGSGLQRRALACVERKTEAWCWGSGMDLAFHSERERTGFLGVWCTLAPRAQTSICDHGRFFRRYGSSLQPREARQRLGVDSGSPLFLCIGFIGRHKGFDRAIQAFAHGSVGKAQLYVVGSCLYDSGEVSNYIEELRLLAQATPGVHFEQRFVDDAEFDLWVQAADAILVPYRSIASSSVVARARLYGTRVVATAVGGLPEQLGPDDILVESDSELTLALEALAHHPPSSTVTSLERG